MKKWMWVATHVALDAWEAKAALLRRVAGVCALLGLAFGAGLASWGAWDMVPLARGGSMNAARPLAYAPSRHCAQELSALPASWRVKPGPLEFLYWPRRERELVFACRTEGGRQWIERREARGGASDWVARVRKGEKGGLDARGLAAFERLEAMSWEAREARPSFRAWREALGLAELSEASRGVAASSDAAANSSALSWTIRALTGLFMSVVLASWLIMSFTAQWWPLLALVMIGLTAAVLARGVAPAPNGQGWRSWIPTMVGAGAAVLTVPAGLAVAAAARWGFPGLNERAGLSWGAEAGWLEMMGVGLMGALWLVAIVGGLGFAGVGAARVPAALKGWRERAGARAEEMMQNSEFQARAQRRELKKLTGFGVGGEEREPKRPPRL